MINDLLEHRVSHASYQFFIVALHQRRRAVDRDAASAEVSFPVRAETRVPRFQASSSGGRANRSPEPSLGVLSSFFCGIQGIRTIGGYGDL